MANFNGHFGAGWGNQGGGQGPQPNHNFGHGQGQAPYNGHIDGQFQFAPNPPQPNMYAQGPPPPPPYPPPFQGGQFDPNAMYGIGNQANPPINPFAQQGPIPPQHPGHVNPHVNHFAPPYGGGNPNMPPGIGPNAGFRAPFHITGIKVDLGKIGIWGRI
jgi:hypothetical protein